ncbi:hypothetical protein RRG08_036286 [Elysia crispata]|uniref:Uncharacterized protein n=1 Tax=Elysia crispata TaxID=231223 RepID=A0AAE1DLK9_9GAST|nr:hypothetical protein RRG08_036286 [Elysia crispata]
MCAWPPMVGCWPADSVHSRSLTQGLVDAMNGPRWTRSGKNRLLRVSIFRVTDHPVSITAKCIFGRGNLAQPRFLGGVNSSTPPAETGVTCSSWWGKMGQNPPPPPRELGKGGKEGVEVMTRRREGTHGPGASLLPAATKNTAREFGIARCYGPGRAGRNYSALSLSGMLASPFSSSSLWLCGSEVS